VRLAPSQSIILAVLRARRAPLDGDNCASPNYLRTDELSGKVHVQRFLMPWKCPACSTPIRQQLMAAGDDAPRPGIIYRCSICRLELVLDAGQMIVAPLAPDTDSDRRRRP
jgi:hypothetical protein